MKLNELEVWFVTGSQGLYGPETLDQVAEQSRKVAERIADDAQVPVREVWKPVLTSSDAIQRLFLEANSADNCVGGVAWMHPMSPGTRWISGVDAVESGRLDLAAQAEVEPPRS